MSMNEEYRNGFADGYRAAKDGESHWQYTDRNIEYRFVTTKWGDTAMEVRARDDSEQAAFTEWGLNRALEELRLITKR